MHLQVLSVAKAAALSVAKDAAILRRLLQQCLPADLFNSLDIDQLIKDMIASTVGPDRLADWLLKVT